MDSHGWIFWALVPFLFVMFIRRAGNWGHSGSARRKKMQRTMQKHIRAGFGGDPDLDYKQDEELAEHRHYIDELEKRVAELENRLDFTERLLAGRRESVVEGSQDVR